MLTYNSKFAAELKKGKSDPATLVYLQDSIFFDEKTLQADWILNTSENNVDYTPSPPALGDVELLLPDIWDPTLTDASAGRGRHSAIEYNGKMYVFGGYSGGITNHVREYDISGDSWSNKTSGATARIQHSAIEYNGKMYVFGGYTGSVNLNDVRIYDIAGDSWSSGTSGATIRAQHIGVEYNGKMYIYGGQNAGSHINTLFEYDIAGDSWTQLTSGPGGRSKSVAIAYGGKIYVHGGFDGVTGKFDEIWEYDIIGDSWTQLASGGVARIGHTAIEYAGEMYIFGGTDATWVITNPWKYDPVSNTWLQLTDGSSLREGHSAIEYNGKMYIFGGWDTSIYRKDIWSHDMGYSSSGHITTNNFDLGSVPTAPGEWSIGDVVPAGTSLTYEAWSSSTGLFAGEEIYLGFIVDGDAITDLKRYYRVKASFVSNPLRDKTPILSSIIADFAEYIKIDHSIGLTSLTTTIDLFEESTISQMTVTLALTKVTSNWMATKKPRNKRVRIFIGFRADGFTDDDFEKFYFGTVANADITSDNKVKIFVDGFPKDWKENVPDVWEDSGDNVVWIDEHPIDVTLDIYRQYLPVRDSALLLSSFEEVRAQIPDWRVSRTITNDPVEGKKLLEELRKLMSCFFIPQPDGKTKLKRWDPNEAAVLTITDTQLMSKNHKGNYKEITNRLYIYYNWAGTGDEAGDFDAVFPDVRSDSRDDYGKFETKVIKDKWTGSAQLSQVQDRATKLLDRYENPPPLMPGVMDLKNLAIEEGDIINVTTKRAPSTDMTGISDVPFQLVKKQINWQGKRLSWELLAVTG